MYKELLDELWDLDKDLFPLVDSLKNMECQVKDSYRTKYIDLVFELYSSGYNFSQITEEVCDVNDSNDICDLMSDFSKFINSYARLLQFFTFAEIDEPNELWIMFNYWKNKRLDIIECQEEDSNRASY